MRTITLGQLPFTDTATVRFRKMRITGWDGAVGSSQQFKQKTAAPGAWVSLVNPQRSERPIVISGMVIASTVADMLSTLDAINAGNSLQPVQLRVDDDNVSRWLMVIAQASMETTPYPNPLVKDFSLQLVAPDPRKLADALSGSTALPARSGGLTIPFSLPTTINSTVVSGSVSLTNPGNETGPVTFRIAGPVVGPAITSAAGAVLSWPGLTLASGEWLDVDADAQTCLGNGQSSRAGYLSDRDWSGMGFFPGANNWSFSATSGTGALLTVSANPAWK